MSPARARLTAAGLLVLVVAAAAPAGPIRPGFDAAALPAGDAESSGPIDLGFAVNFFGQTFASVFVNADGNVTFGAPLPDFTPVPLGELRQAIIAPFFADVDTTAAGRITYGTGTVDGRPAFAATWDGVGYYDQHSDKRNDFQVVLVDRSDTGAGNFDAEFNYGRLGWETGDFNGGVGGRGGSSARAGVGSAGAFYELPGSGRPGLLLDDGPALTALALTMLNGDTAGRHVLYGRDGAVVGAAAPPDDPTPGPVGGGDPDPTPGGGGVVGTPEPATAVLAAIGAGVVAARCRRRARVSVGA